MSRVPFIIMLINLSLASLAEGAIASSEINQILKKGGIDPSQVTLEIRDQDKTLFAVNPSKKMIPASVTKILTSYAVLKNIPLNHKFKTELLYDGNNLYVRGGGDPGFVSENMWNMVNDFKREGIHKITGNIVIDDSLFDQVRYDESRESKRVDRSYDAPVSALSFNWNSVNVYIKPVENKVRAYVDPESDYFKLVNGAKVTKGNSIKELILSIDQDRREIRVSGELSSYVDEKAYFKNVKDPVNWFGENLKSFLQQRRIEVAGKIVSGVIPPGARVVSTVESKTLSNVLADMNKFSNNFVAEMLTKNLASLGGERPATLATGVDIIKHELEKIGIKPSEFTVENPSGFSRENRFSAHVLNDVLVAIKKDFKIYPTFIEGLPISGFDGTLKKRMKGSEAEGYVRAKTGYLDGVVSIAGYAGNSKSSVYTFSFIYNGPKDEAAVRGIFDKVLAYLVTRMD